jgi:hypothetical protein
VLLEPDDDPVARWLLTFAAGVLAVVGVVGAVRALFN